MRAAAVLLSSALVLWGTACSRPPSQPKNVKNVVLISLDTLRLDRMSLFGGARRTTPAIESLARDGVTFDRAYTAAPWTLPAHAAMLTGRYPSSLSDVEDAPLYRLAPMLSTMLKERGYDTAAVTGGGFVDAGHGANVGFDAYHEGEVDLALDWLGARRSDAPFFLFFHTYAAHLPYRDFRFVQGVDGGQLTVLRDGSPKERLAAYYALTCGLGTYTEAEKAFLLATYDGGVAAADELVGRLVAALRDRQLLAETIVIVTSDHGEEFWDHANRAAYHGHTLYNELLHVPLVWYDPALARRGVRVVDPVSLVDIVPTVLARLGLPPAADLDGIDVGSLLDGRSLGGEHALFAEAVRHGPPRHGVITAAATLLVNGAPDEQRREGRTCAVPVAAPRELYLAADGAERVDRFAAEPVLAERLDVQLQAAGQAHTRKAQGAPKAAPATIDDATRRRLGELGYVE
jgi:arylsulfatase A-like enzyme